jgi:hypothetical protein
MKNHTLFLVFIFIALISCTKKYFHDFDYDYVGEKNYRNIYIVDTINIDDPITVFHETSGCNSFVLSRATLKYYDGKKDFFFRPDVFICSNDLMGDMAPQTKDFYRYHPNGLCQFTFDTKEKKYKGLSIREFEQKPKYFLLGLFNDNYYYKRYNCSNGYFAYGNNNKKLVYIKILYPMCDEIKK